MNDKKALFSKAIISDDCRRNIHQLFLKPATAKGRSSNTVYAMAGIPGAGKSTYVKASIQNGQFPPDAFILNPDLVMEALPGYQEDYLVHGAVAAFSRWEIPARALADDLLETAISLHLDIILDMGAARKENYELIRRLKEVEGYYVQMYWLHIPIETALARIASRDRFTPESMVHERAAALALLRPAYEQLADTITDIHLHQ